MLVQFKLLLCYHLHRSSLRNLCHCLYVATIMKTSILFLAIFLSSFFFFFLTIVNFQNMIFDTTNCKCHSPRITPLNGTAVPKLLLQLSREKRKREKKRKKVGFQSIICLWLKVKKRTGNSVGEKKNSLCKAPFTKQMHLCIIFFLLFSLPPRSKALSTCKQSQATARNQSQH